ncbi:fasciclin domain-containing protein [Niabella insulamsoli]|uniref:fasciclin domain-containing protein n=1 Tax=Niabella insulamsoli TaxID=3144874 RepID=UPI0031FBD966
MFFNKNIIRQVAGIIFMAAMVACNKELPEPKPIEPDPPADAETILQKLDASEFSILKAAVTKASTFTSPTGKVSDILGNATATMTFFAPDNAALLRSFALLGLPASEASLNFFTAGKLDTLLKYHLIGGEAITSGRINPAAPALNLYLQSMLVLSAPSANLPPGYRMPIFMGKQGNSVFANNIPVTAPDMAAANGVMHKVYVALLPPDKVLWQTIFANADGGYNYFKAAVIRADGGINPEGQFQAALSAPNANFTALIPTNAAFEQLLIARIAGALIIQGEQPAVANLAAQGLVAAHGSTIISDPASIQTYGPQLAAFMTRELAQAIVAYHLLAKPAATPVGYRNYTVNFPAGNAALVPTLVNASVANHPGVALQATFGPAGVTAATAKGLGNETASNIILSAPPSSTNDVNHVNGVIHRIDQVLLPQ